ncbi:hypothetical protein K474DRAFT_1655486 [Panus rudis PR-1116 ss-1]|nr:hypothetical protein K474DRAFT_1655486 [Panus rudis PR-1116 ss-1]
MPLTECPPVYLYYYSKDVSEVVWLKALVWLTQYAMLAGFSSFSHIRALKGHSQCVSPPRCCYAYSPRCNL